MTDNLTFGQALDLIQAGKRVARQEWKNARCVFLVAGSEFEVNRAPLLGIFAAGTKVTYRPHVDMIGADGTVGTWAPSMVDMLSDDWFEFIEAQ